MSAKPNFAQKTKVHIWRLRNRLKDRAPFFVYNEDRAGARIGSLNSLGGHGDA